MTAEMVSPAGPESAADIPLYGKQIHWSLPGVALLEGEVKKLLVEAGLNPDATPKVRGTTTAARTLKKLQQDSEGGFVTEAPAPNGCTYFFLVLPGFDAAGQIGFRTERVTYDPVTDTLTAENPDRQSDVDAALARFANCLLGADIRRALTRIVQDEGGVPYAPGSGVYILPESKADVADRIDTFVRSLGKRCKVRIMELTKTEQNRQTMEAASRDDILAEIAQLSEELTKLEDSNVIAEGGDNRAVIVGYQASFVEALVVTKPVRRGDKLQLLAGGAFMTFEIDRANDDGTLTLAVPAQRPISGSFTIERPSETRVRASTWANKMKTLQAKLTKAEMYADLLAYKADDIRQAIAEQMARVQARMLGAE
jgi:hypothetical protein